MLGTRLDYFNLRSIAHRRRYPDPGRGTGELTIAFVRPGAGGFAGSSAGSITGIDILPRLIPSPSPVNAMNEGARS